MIKITSWNENLIFAVKFMSMNITFSRFQVDVVTITIDSHFALYGGVVPPKCMPSPRTVARVASSTRRAGAAGGTPFNIRRGFQRFETLLDDVELGSGHASTGRPRPPSPRSYPITHPPCDPPLCSVSGVFISFCDLLFLYFSAISC